MVINLLLCCHGNNKFIKISPWKLTIFMMRIVKLVIFLVLIFMVFVMVTGRVMPFFVVVVVPVFLAPPTMMPMVLVAMVMPAPVVTPVFRGVVPMGTFVVAKNMIIFLNRHGNKLKK